MSQDNASQDDALQDNVSQTQASALNLSAPMLSAPASTPESDGLMQDYPIHLINAIQPHGVLLALDEADFSILQVSANTQEYLGVEPEDLLGVPFELLCDTAPLRSLVERLSSEESLEASRVMPVRLSVKAPVKLPVQTPPVQTPPVQTSPGTASSETASSGTASSGTAPAVAKVTATAASQIAFDSFIHLTCGVVMVEMEPAEPGHAASPSGFHAIHALIRDALNRMQRAETREALLSVVVDEIRRLTGFDRVLVYRFDGQGAGAVIAEAKHADISPFLGLHFPARDVPAVSRQLYARGKLRTIPNIPAIAVPLIPYQNPKTGELLDLSLSVLRSSDACSVEYYANMGIAAAMVASLLKDQQLWGLIACHHVTPKKLSYETKAACELLAQIASSELGNKVRQAALAQRARMQSLQSELIASIAQADNFAQALRQPKTRLLSLVEASGAVIRLGDELTLLGKTPTQEQMQGLIRWASDNVTDNLFHTACLSQQYPEAAAFQGTASGLLLLQISTVQQYQIFWFRPEVLQTVNWAGDPEDGIDLDQSGQVHLGPRRSFDVWQESVRATSLPWQAYERQGAIALRNAIVGIVLKKADELAKLNRELNMSNRELASFAYAAAHDLKEPLRGIYNYANILIEDYAPDLDEEGQAYLNDIQVFSQRMETLINALLRIAGLRQTELHLETVALDELLENAVAVVRASRPDTHFDLRLPRSLPRVDCDPVLVNEVFRNLISNALKYSDRSDKWVEIGYETQATSAKPIFYVRDNGIGLREEHLTKVFQLFKRLHPQDRYDGGAGVGLAVVNQIIDRHGGRLWVESVFGEGSTFYFTLA